MPRSKAVRLVLIGLEIIRTRALKFVLADMGLVFELHYRADGKQCKNVLIPRLTSACLTLYLEANTVLSSPTANCSVASILFCVWVAAPVGSDKLPVG